MLGTDSCPLKPFTRASRGLKDQPGSPAPGGRAPCYLRAAQTSHLDSQMKWWTSIYEDNDGIRLVNDCVFSAGKRKLQGQHFEVLPSCCCCALVPGKVTSFTGWQWLLFSRTLFEKINFHVHVMKKLLYVEKSFLPV